MLRRRPRDLGSAKWLAAGALGLLACTGHIGDPDQLAGVGHGFSRPGRLDHHGLRRRRWRFDRRLGRRGNERRTAGPRSWQAPPSHALPAREYAARPPGRPRSSERPSRIRCRRVSRASARRTSSRRTPASTSITPRSRPRSRRHSPTPPVAQRSAAARRAARPMRRASGLSSKRSAALRGAVLWMPRTSTATQSSGSPWPRS